MSTTIVLITGGNTGLGLELINSLRRSAQSYQILMGSRSIEKAEKAIHDIESSESDSRHSIEAVEVDVEYDDSIQSAFELVKQKYGRLDVLVNNAGASFDQMLFAGEIGLREAWNKSWSVNTTGAHVVTSTFVPLLLNSPNPRIVFIASGTATLAGQQAEKLPLDRPPTKGWPKQQPSWSSYRSAKTGMNMMMREWSRLLKDDGVKVWAVSPGLLATGLGGNSDALKKMGAQDPEVGAHLIKSVIEGSRIGDAGLVVNKDGIQAW